MRLSASREVGGRDYFRRAQICHAPLARSREIGAARIDGDKACLAHCRNRTWQVAAGQNRANRLRQKGSLTRSACGRWGASARPRNSTNIILKTGNDGHPRSLERCRPRGNWARRITAPFFDSNGHDAVGLAVTQLPGANAPRCGQGRKGGAVAALQKFPSGDQGSRGLRYHDSHR